MTAYHWRIVRLKLTLAGISHPLAMTTMHALLDCIEHIVLESMVSNKPDQDKIKREQFLSRLYAVTEQTRRINGDGYLPQPAGFEPDEVEASFDAFAAAARGSGDSA